MSRLDKVLLGDLIEVLSGFAFKSERFNTTGNGLPLIRIRDVMRGSSDTYYDGPYEDKYIVKPGDLLVGMDGEFNSRVWRTGTALLNQRVCKIVPSKSLDFSYLCHVLPKHLKAIEARTPFVTVKHLSVKNIQKIEIPLPPLPEQKRIAAILDKADAICQKREKAIELTDSFLRSVFLEMFGDPLQNPKGWNVIKLESAFNEERSGTCCGPFGSALKKHEYVDSGVPVWGINNVSPNRFTETDSLFITPEKYAQLKRYNAIEGDILISRAGTVGRMCVCHPSSLESIIGTNLIRLSLNEQKMLPYYFTSLYTYFASRLPGLRSSGDPDAYSFLNTTKLAELNIPCPPIDIQRDFEQVLIKTRAMQVKLVNASAVKETLIASLSSALLKQNASSRRVALSEPQQEAHAL